MTRLRFLLLSFFSSVAGVFGARPDREALALAWLEANGFTYSDRSAATGFSRIIWYHRAIGYSVFHFKTDRVDGVFFMRCLERRDFVIEERHITYEPVPSEQRSLNEWNVGFIEVENTLPTLHRFTRPEWF